MNEKNLIQSKTIWGAIIMALMYILQAVDPSLVPTDEQITNLIAGVGAGVGLVLAVVGRYTARKRIKPPRVLSNVGIAVLFGMALLAGGCSTLSPESKAAIKQTLIQSTIRILVAEATRSLMEANPRLGPVFHAYEDEGVSAGLTAYIRAEVPGELGHMAAITLADVEAMIATVLSDNPNNERLRELVEQAVLEGVRIALYGGVDSGVGTFSIED